MSFEDQEKSEFELFGLKFQATFAEQRALWLKLSMSTESKEWGICRNLVNLVVARAEEGWVHRLAARMDAAEQAMTRLAAHLIDEMEALRQ